MKHHKLIATLLGISVFSYSISQTKQKSKDDSYLKELAENERLEAERRVESSRNRLVEKQISVEIPVTHLTNIIIENNNRPIEVKTWSESKVKISVASSVFQGSNNSFQSLDAMNVYPKLLGNSLIIKANAINNASANSSKDAAIGENNWTFENDISIKKTVTIYLPRENKLSIESKYADVSVTDYLKRLNVDITNGSLELGKINSLKLRSKYANVSINEVQNGEIDFINGKLSIQNLGEVDLDTKYSTVEIGNAKKINFKSTNDEYELEDIAILEGSKNYGNLRISKLTESIQLDGTNADIKIKYIGSQTKSIWIDNKYADLRIPLKNIKNFDFSYDGTYSTIYKNFAVYANTINGSNNSNISSLEDSKITTGDLQNSKFKANVGTGKDAKIEIKCQNCTVDLK